jgi:hypothetical protein
LTEYALDPEVAGDWGPETVADTQRHPPVVHRLHYEFAGWLGDDIVASFPVFLVSERLAVAIDEEALSGAQLDDVKVTKDPQFEEFFPDLARSLPEWRWLRPVGEPHMSDFWSRPDGQLVVSERAMNLLRRFNIEHCDTADV